MEDDYYEIQIYKNGKPVCEIVAKGKLNARKEIRAMFPDDAPPPLSWGALVSIIVRSYNIHRGVGVGGREFSDGKKYISICDYSETSDKGIVERLIDAFGPDSKT